MAARKEYINNGKVTIELGPDYTMIRVRGITTEPAKKADNNDIIFF